MASLTNQNAKYKLSVLLEDPAWPLKVQDARKSLEETPIRVLGLVLHSAPTLLSRISVRPTSLVSGFLAHYHLHKKRYFDGPSFLLWCPSLAEKTALSSLSTAPPLGGSAVL